MNTMEPQLKPAMPYAEGPEKSVLSILLQEPEMLDEVPNLTAEHFHTKARQTIFLLIRELVNAGKPVELVSFTQILIDRGLLDRVGGAHAVADLHNYEPNPKSLQSRFAMLADKLARRMAIKTAHEIERVAFEAAEASELLDATSVPISRLHDVLTSNRPARDTKSVLKACLSRFEMLCRGEADPMGIECSLFELNRRFLGLHGKQTVVISGYPGGGKTTLAGQLAMDAAIDGHNTLVCSLEMPEEKMMNRMLAYVARLPGIAVTEPMRYAREFCNANGPTVGTLEAIRKAALTIARSPFAIEEMIGSNVHQISACIRRAHRKSPLKVVVVDFIQRIRTTSDLARENRERQLADASNTLADLSKELGFCLLLPSQLNKDGAAKHAEVINEDADLHLQIAQDRSGPNATQKHLGIAVMKDRHCGQGGELLPLVLDGPMLRFVPERP